MGDFCVSVDKSRVREPTDALDVFQKSWCRPFQIYADDSGVHGHSHVTHSIPAIGSRPEGDGDSRSIDAETYQWRGVTKKPKFPEC